MVDTRVNMMLDDEGESIFAFHDLDYIPFGFSSDTAPYIETPIATMRAAAKIMHLGPESDTSDQERHVQSRANTVVCDLGCGDGEFLLSLLRHINTPNPISKPLCRPLATGVGVDYDAELIKTAGLESTRQMLSVDWLVYDFNADLEDIVGQLLSAHNVTHVFVALVPKQLALPAVRKILTSLCKRGALVCCYKYHPLYLKAARSDVLMNLVVYDETS